MIFLSIRKALLGNENSKIDKKQQTRRAIMLKRLLLTILLAIGLVAMIGAEAPAGGIFGWYYNCCSALTGEIEVAGREDSVVSIYAMLTMEQACETAGQGNYSIGNAFTQEIELVIPLIEGYPSDGGRAIVPVNIPLDGYSSINNCINPNGWTPIYPDGIGVTAAYLVHTYSRCTDKDETPCVDDEGNPAVAKKPYDVVTVLCTLSDLLRNDDGTVVHGQVMFCPEIVE